MLKLILFTLITLNCFNTFKSEKLNDWENCGSSDDHIHDLDISYTPQIISKGDTINLKITGNLDEDVKSGEIDYKVLIGRFPINNILADSSVYSLVLFRSLYLL